MWSTWNIWIPRKVSPNVREASTSFLSCWKRWDWVLCISKIKSDLISRQCIKCCSSQIQNQQGNMISTKLWTETTSYLVESVVVDSDIIKLGTLLNIFEVCLWSCESKLVFVHIWDMPQDVLTATLGYNLSEEKKMRTSGLAALEWWRLSTTDWQHSAAVKVMKPLAAGQTDANLERLSERQRHEPETHLLSFACGFRRFRK